jgi:hypothetical protein
MTLACAACADSRGKLDDNQASRFSSAIAHKKLRDSRITATASNNNHVPLPCVFFLLITIPVWMTLAVDDV